MKGFRYTDTKLMVIIIKRLNFQILLLTLHSLNPHLSFPLILLPVDGCPTPVDVSFQMEKQHYSYRWSEMPYTGTELLKLREKLGQMVSLP